MSRPGDRPRWSRTIPKGADPDERARREKEAALAAKVERNLQLDRERAAGRAEKLRRGGQLGPEEEAYEAGHELRDMRTRQVIKYLALLTVAVVVLAGAVTVFEGSLIGGIGPLRPVIDDPPRVTPPPQPRLETSNGEMLRVLHERENRILNNYTWIDQGAGKVSLPIERALELTLQRGLPVRTQPNGEVPTGGALLQGSSSGRTSERIP